jgi:hypothetical protein
MLPDVLSQVKRREGGRGGEREKRERERESESHEITWIEEQTT